MSQGAHAWAPEPALVLDAELSDGSLHLPGGGQPADGAPRLLQILVRLHRRPLGLVNTRSPLPDAARELPRLLDAASSRAAAEHLAADAKAVQQPILDARPPAMLPCSHETRLRDVAVPTLTVVVPTCNRVATLLPCVRSVLRSLVPPHEVIVVENRPAGSGVATALRGLETHGTRLLCVEEPRQGVSAARNRGLEQASGEVVVFLDDDVLVDEHALAHVLQAFVEVPQADCVTGLILPLQLETPAQLLLEQYGGYAKGFHRKIFDASRRATDAMFPYDAGRVGSGACVAVRRAAARSVGGFDTELGGGTVTASGEDLDLFIRLLLGGHVVVYEPSVITWHRHRGSMPQLRRQMYLYGRGLAAVITKQLLFGSQRRDLIRRVPAGLHHLLSPSSARNAAKTRAYPLQLTLLELAGMLTGPAVLLSSRRRRRTPTAR